MGEILSRSFYSRDPALVARDLIGKHIIRRQNGEVLEGVIVETEAYYGLMDPASRASKGMKNYNKMMWREPGRVFIYNVHKYWMFNIVAHEPGGVGAVLIRAIEPIQGVNVMLIKRPVKNLYELASGPGKLTMALGIDKRLQGFDATIENSEVYVLDEKKEFQIGTSHRIGVKKDLEEELRFFVERSRFVSK